MKSHPPPSLPRDAHAPAGAAVESAPGQSLTGHEPPASDRAATPIEDVEELTNRLPTSELIRIIKGALECGKRNLPFTQSDLLRAMTIPPPPMGGGSSLGANATYARTASPSLSGASPELSGRARRR